MSPPLTLGIETSLLLSLSQSREWQSLAKEVINWRRCFQIASINRVLYFLITKIYPDRDCLNLHPQDRALFDSVYLQAEQEQKKLERTYAIWDGIQRKLNLDYRIIKTHKFISDIANDLDILIPKEAYPEVSSLLSKYTHRKGVERKGRQFHFQYDELIQIDLHTIQPHPTSNAPVVLINGTHFVDTDFIWENPEIFYVGGQGFLKPNVTADCCVTMVNTLFGHFYLSLNEIATFNANQDKIERSRIQIQAQKYQWEWALRRYFEYVDCAIEKLWSSSEVSILVRGNSVSVPILFSYWDVLLFFLEKARSRVGLKGVDLYNAIYLLYAKARYYFTRGTRVPIHGHWCKELR